MAAVQRGLGRGLDALLQGIDADDDAPSEKGIVLIPIADIRPNAQQPRRDFVDEALKELADSIRSSGVLQPILVRPLDSDTHRFELVAGERRWRASQMADLTDIPAMVRELDDQESLAIALIENLQREDLNPIEEALGLRRLQEDFGLKQEDLASKVGKSRPAIANTMRLLQLPDDIQVDIRNGGLSAGHGRSLLAVADEAARSMLHARCVEQGLSVREAEAQASYWKKTGALPGEETAKPKAGKAATTRDVPEEIQELQNRLADMLGVRVAIKGDMEKGRLILAYASQAQLDGLVEQLGCMVVPQDALVAAQNDAFDIGDEPPEIADLPSSALEEALAEEDVIEEVDPVDAMLAGDDADDAADADTDADALADMLGDDEDAEENPEEVQGDEDEEDVEDFDDDELAELDRALDEILDETKNM